MSKQEYMTKLIAALQDFGSEIREEIINDYEDHFVNGIRAGKTEDEIAEELGSIDELISDLNALSGRPEGKTGNGAETGEPDNDEGTDSSFSEDAGARINDIIKSFAALIGEMAAGVAKGTGKVSSSVGSGAKDFARGTRDFANNFASGFVKGYENIANGVGNVADKVVDKTSKFAKEVSDSYRRAMNLPPNEEGEDCIDADMEDFNDFEVDDAADVTRIDPDINMTFEYTSDETKDEAADEFEDEEESEFVSLSDDIENVVIEVESAEVYIDSCADETVTFEYENDGNPNQKLLYKFDYKQKGRTVYASIKKQPGLSNFFKTLGCPDISLYVGINNDAIKKISVRTMSGEVTVNEIGVNQLKINSMSGDITLEDCSVKASQLSTMSGDINIDMNEASSLAVSSISGDIEFDGSSESMHVKTTSGDVELTVTNENSDITVSTVSGDINIELENASGFVANVNSTAGSISLSYDGEDREVTRSGNYIMGEGQAKLSLNSVSGDIDVSD